MWSGRPTWELNTVFTFDIVAYEDFEDYAHSIYKSGICLHMPLHTKTWLHRLRLQ